MIRMNNKPQAKKSSVTDDIERLKQRREDRKNKNEDKKTDHSNGKAVDADYENLMKKRKKTLNIQPDEVEI